MRFRSALDTVVLRLPVIGDFIARLAVKVLVAAFAKSNGIVIKVGDRSHPNAVAFNRG